MPGEGEPRPGFGVYVHWPFCAAKCPYCDFNSHVRQAIDHKAWRDALTADISTQASSIDRPRVSSIFFGGGTPSLMEPRTVAAVIDRISSEFPLADQVEITLEANPTSVEAEKFRAFRTAGVNRISMGIQAFDDEDLRRLGRMHSAQEAMASFDIARHAFDRVSFDLIYARQHQSTQAWERELAMAMSLAVDHLSLYQLTIETGTRFGELASRGGLMGLPEAPVAAEMFELTRAVTADLGMPAYEVSNHARSGAECRHNLIYWRYGGYLGVGPGAHGRVKRGDTWVETTATRAPEAWLNTPENRTETVALGPEERGVEMLLMSLRLTEGLDVARFEAVSGHRLNATRVRDLLETGHLVRSNSHLKATEAGVLVLNTVVSQLCDAWEPV